MTSKRRLTWRGFQRRQHAIAKAALKRYFSEAVPFRLVSSSTNFIYTVRSPQGERFILRLAFPGWRTAGDAALETAWLDVLARDTDLSVPNIVPALDGERVLAFDDPFNGRPRHAVLMTRLPGMLLGKRLNPGNLFKMGELFAKLHIHAAGWRPVGGLPEKRFDRYLSRGEPELLFGADMLAGCAPRDVEVLHRAAERVAQVYDSLDRADLRVIHCDLWHDNVKLYQGRLAPFDFEDAIPGFRLHDIAMAMLDLAEDAGIAAYDERLLPAFRAGYEAHLPWPEGDLVALQMGRVLWRTNWVARHQPERFPESVRFYADLMKRCEMTGELTAPLKPD